MAWSGFVRNALLCARFGGIGAPPVEAVEIVGGAQAPAQISDGWLTQVRNVRHGGGGARHAERTGRSIVQAAHTGRFIARAACIDHPPTVRRSTVPAIARR